MYLNVFENYAMHIRIPSNIETVGPDLKMISYKYQDKDKSILNNAIGDTILIQIYDKIKETDLPIKGQLYGGT